jgi:hypothetical protein
MTGPHASIESLHQPLLLSGKQLGGLVASREKMLGLDGSTFYFKISHISAQLIIEPPFVGALIFEAGDAQLADQHIKVGGERLRVGRVINPEIADAMTGPLQPAAKVPHRGKDGQNLLGMVQHIIRLLPDFHEHINDIIPRAGEPTMQRVELIPQH